LEITYIKEGKLTVKRGEESSVAHKGDLVINCFEGDTVTVGEEYHCHHTVGFSLEYEKVGSLPAVISVDKNSTQIYHLIDEIIKLKSLVPDSETKQSGLFLQLIGEIELESEKSGADTAEYRYVSRAKQYIYDNITLPIRQSDIAELLGITPEYLCAIFKKSTGETVMRFVNRLKLSGVRSLMESEKVPLYSAAEHFGFSDPNYVSRLYVKLFGECITRVDRN
jgi:AraC-like DNA-binding protein